MPFDDVGFYVGLCAAVARSGARIGLRQRPHPARARCGAASTRSASMRRRGCWPSCAARRRCGRCPRGRSGWTLPVSRCDPDSPRSCARIRSLPMSPMTKTVAPLLDRIRGLLAPGGMFVVDAFVPKPVDRANRVPRGLPAALRHAYAGALEAHPAARTRDQPDRAPLPGARCRRDACSNNSRSPKSFGPGRPAALRQARRGRRIRTRAGMVGLRHAAEAEDGAQFFTLSASLAAGTGLTRREPATHHRAQLARRTPHESAAAALPDAQSADLDRPGRRRARRQRDCASIGSGDCSGSWW